MGCLAAKPARDAGLIDHRRRAVLQWVKSGPQGQRRAARQPHTGMITAAYLFVDTKAFPDYRLARAGLFLLFAFFASLVSQHAFIVGKHHPQTLFGCIERRSQGV